MSAGGGEILSGSTAGVLLGVAASLAALGLVLEALFLVELLLTGGEHKFVAAFLAYQGLVLENLFGTGHHDFFVHCFYLALMVVFALRRILTDTFEKVQRSGLSYRGI
jgi:hypothetical protein